MKNKNLKEYFVIKIIICKKKIFFLNFEKRIIFKKVFEKNRKSNILNIFEIKMVYVFLSVLGNYGEWLSDLN